MRFFSKLVGEEGPRIQGFVFSLTLSHPMPVVKISHTTGRSHWSLEHTASGTEAGLRENFCFWSDSWIPF
jgi:hypothetical protein